MASTSTPSVSEPSARERPHIRWAPENTYIPNNTVSLCPHTQMSSLSTMESSHTIMATHIDIPASPSTGRAVVVARGDTGSAPQSGASQNRPITTPSSMVKKSIIMGDRDTVAHTSTVPHNTVPHAEQTYTASYTGGGGLGSSSLGGGAAAQYNNNPNNSNTASASAHVNNIGAQHTHRRSAHEPLYFSSNSNGSLNTSSQSQNINGRNMGASPVFNTHSSEVGVSGSRAGVQPHNFSHHHTTSIRAHRLAGNLSMLAVVGVLLLLCVAGPSALYLQTQTGDISAAAGAFHDLATADHLQDAQGRTVRVVDAKYWAGVQELPQEEARRQGMHYISLM